MICTPNENKYTKKLNVNHRLFQKQKYEKKNTWRAKGRRIGRVS